MSNTKNTPGPWEPCMWVVPDHTKQVFPETDGATYMIKIRKSNGKLIGGTYGYLNHKEEAEANAKLIAAAPELLEALQGLVKDVRNKPNDTRYATHIKIAEAAIKKATE